MIKMGNRVSLFANMGKEGTVVGFKKNPIKNKYWSSIPEASSQMLIVIQWDDGVVETYPVGEVMRID